MLVALVRPVPPSINRCEVTHIERTPIDFARATEQHAGYEQALEALGCRLEHVEGEPEMADSVFIEDTTVAVDELAVITRPGAESRRGETAGVAKALANYRKLAWIDAPGTLDGGDVLRVGRELFVGRTARSNDDGIAQLRALLAPFGYSVRGVEVHGALHLKTAITEAGDGLLLVNREWIDVAPFAGYELLDVDPAEPFAANVLRMGAAAIVPSAHPRTAARLEARGIATRTVDASELAKAEGGVTCCSVLLHIV